MALLVDDGGDRWRHCTSFPLAEVSFAEIGGGTGRKLVARNGVAAPCP